MKHTEFNIRSSTEYIEFGSKIVKCPVCGIETLDNYYPCPGCRWKYDSIKDPNTRSQENDGYTINEYKAMLGY